MSHYSHSFGAVVKPVLIAVYCLLFSSVGCFSTVNKTPRKGLCLQTLVGQSSGLLIQHLGDVRMLQAQRLVTLAWASSSLLGQPLRAHLCVELTSCGK